MEKSLDELGNIVVWIFVLVLLHSCSSYFSDNSQSEKLDLIVEKCVKK